MANDFNAQTTIDRRTMATLARFFESKGADIRSLSELTRLALESLATIAVEKLGTEEVTSSNEATNILIKLTYGSALLNSKRFGAGLLTNLHEPAEVDGRQFDEGVSLIPKGRGRQPSWSENDDKRMRAAAERMLGSPKIQELLKQLNSEKEA